MGGEEGEMMTHLSRSAHRPHQLHQKQSGPRATGRLAQREAAGRLAQREAAGRLAQDLAGGVDQRRCGPSTWGAN